MSSHKVGVQVKAVSHRALHTHCFSHCLNVSIAVSCGVPEVINLIMVINEAYLFLSNSPKRQSMFKLAVVKLTPASSHKKLPGLCRTRWVKRHTCYEVFLELYQPFITFLDVIVSPNDCPQLESSDGSWNWDRETKIIAEGLKASLYLFNTISATKNILDEAKSLSAKLQKRDLDVHQALSMVNDVVVSLGKIRTNVDTIFSSWYDEILKLSEAIGVVESTPRKTSFQRNKSNTPSSSPSEHYKPAIAIPVLSQSKRKI